MQIALFIVAAALMAGGVWMLLKQKGAKGGRNKIEMLGMKFDVGGPALVLIVIGAVLALASAGRTASEPPAQPDTVVTPTPTNKTPEFTSIYTFRPNDIVQREPAANADANLRGTLVLERCEFGTLDHKGKAVRASFRFHNLSARPITLSTAARYFVLTDDHPPRQATVSVFNAPPPEDIVDAGQERTIVVVFDTTGWHGKEDGARKLYLAVTNVLAGSQAKWEITPLIAAAE